MLSPYLETALLEYVLHGVDFVPPESIYLALFTDDPGESLDNEVSGGSYARQFVGFTSVTQETDRAVAYNDADIEFADMPETTVTHVGTLDADTGGNLLWYGKLASARDVQAGYPMVVLAGELTTGLL